MFSVTSLDLQVVGDLIKESSCLLEDHFFILYVNEKKVFKSQRKTREPPPQWKEQLSFRFDLSSTIRIAIFRQSFLARVPGKKNMVAEFNGTGVNLLNNSTQHEMRTKSGVSVGWHISVRLDYSSESHEEFMKAVGEDISRIGKVPGSDAAQAATTTAGKLGTVLEKIVPIVDKFAGAHPILYAAWTVLSSAYKVVQQQIITDSSVGELLEQLREVAGVAGTCSNLPEIGGTINVLEEIGRTALEAALLIHEYAGPSIGGKPSIFARTAKHSPTNMASRIAQCQKQIDDLIAIFDRRIQLDTNSRVKALQDDQTKMGLDKLVYAGGASWNPKMACLPGTRATIISIIHAWARLLDDQNVCWLKGVAGSGKSAIAHTIAQSLRKDGRLASSFFFDRNVASRNTSQLLVTTIARDIAMIHPAIAADIRTTLEEDPSLASASLSRQFEAFISGPLRRHPIEHSFLIVIDALDEIVHEDLTIELLEILRDEASKLPPQIRILVTSRPTRDIIDYLSKQSHIASHPIDIASVENGQDIEAYIGHQLQDPILHKRMGSPHSTEALVRDLKNLAGGLFIWIVTVFRYLHNADNPEGKLRALLSKTGTPGRLDPSKIMDALYTVILELCGDWQDPEFCKGYRMLMGAIMAAKRPLSLGALRALHGDTLMLSPGSLPQRFGSVLVGLDDDDEPIRVLHLSFLEFITGHTPTSSKFHIAEKEHSGRLAELCLQTMVREIAADTIRGTGYLFQEDDDEPGIPKVFGVSEQLLYCCEYWSDHVCDVEEPAAIAEAVQAFLPDHNTIWIEIVSSMSVFRGSLAAWRWLQVRSSEFKEQGHESQASILVLLSRRLKYAGRLEEALVASQEAVDVHRAPVTEQPATPNADLAGCLDNLSTQLSALRRWEEALAVIKEAVYLYRALAIERPTAFNGDLARSLKNLSARLSNLGRHEEALVEIKTAVDLQRGPSAERSGASDYDLAGSLNNLSAYLSALGRHDEALPAIKEALDIYHVLAADRPAAFNIDLARSINNLSGCLSDLGQDEEALAATKEALDLYRALAAERPSVFNADLAGSLISQSAFLSALGRHEEALAATKEALDLYRAVATERPMVFNADLADTLSRLSTDLSALGRREEALVVIMEALDLYCALAAEQPSVFNADFAGSLISQSAFLSDLGRHGEALVAIKEAVDLYRELAAEKPGVLNGDLARSLSLLSVHLQDLGRDEEALAVIKETLDLDRALAAEQPAVFDADLAVSLNRLSLCLSGLGRREEALTASKELFDLWRVLAVERPSVFNADLAKSLIKLSKDFSALGLHEEALAAVKEAVDLYRALAADRITTFNADHARSLCRLSRRLSSFGRWEEALVAIKEAVDLYRALAAEQPEAFNADLATSLFNLSLNSSTFGLREEALAAINEALDLYRVLAAEQPAVFNDNLAGSLNTLSYDLSDLDRHEEALVAVTEALEIYRNLAAEQPLAFNLDLANSLDTTSTCLSHLDQGEEALAAIQEAVNLCRGLGTESKRLADFNRSLCIFLINLSARFSYLDRWQEGLAAIHEATEFRRALATEPPAVPNAELVQSVEQFSTFLLKAGHKEESRLIFLELSKLKML
ncbi:TPR-like protein [Athelia psychrophila]|uniref:TPR-like protein n=1 Tax=Athelia psychrophila TaxID=1759441 RepID=A0A166DHY6_9AGAM|nr:TPR-like protein [Fibularhizoctonia sp. CBS 109695]